MKFKKAFSPLGLTAGLLFSLFVNSAGAASLSLAQTPLFLTNQVKPNVMVMLDNSGSMKSRMYTSGYNNSTVYTGIFDSTKTYQYDNTIPVNTGAYGFTIKTGVAGSFVEAVCTPAVGNTTCWNGNFLNWLVTRRIDASREVLIGGKLESRTAFAYTGTLNYKIVGNNERSDGTFSSNYSLSDSLSPIKNNFSAAVASPAETGSVDNGGAAGSGYDPYAKLSYIDEQFIYDSASNKIGEFGQVSADQVAASTTWVTVNLQRTYINPVVVAKPLTYKGADPSIVRIRNVTTTSFEIKVQEWEYKDGAHTTETMPYLVVEKGQHTLTGGVKLEAGTHAINDEYVTRSCGSSSSSSDSISFGSTFSVAPVVLASVVTNADPVAVNARAWSISTTGFKLSLQQEENQGGPGTETVAYIAIEPGVVDDTTNGFLLKAGNGITVNYSAATGNANANRKTVNYNTGTAFSGAPVFMAALQTMNDGDTAVLRTSTVSATSARVILEEEKSCTSPNEIDHPNEGAGYIAIQGKFKSLNIALTVAAEPIGLLHDVDSKVRLGISFYRFPPNKSDIYNGVTTQGGTLKFKIPKNPFVKNPTLTGNASFPAAEQGYRDLTGYIGTSIAGIVDAIEHYPLVWGTTPLAENLVEVIHYFSQIAPNYPAVLTGFEDFDLAVPATTPERDPYYDPFYGKKMSCAKSNVLIFTDGAPFKDADVPNKYVDYDADPVTNPEDFNSTDPNQHGKDNLDDVAYWAFCDKSKATCFNTATPRKAVNGSRDLRTDLVGNQFLRIDTVGFANGTIRPILQDTADNAGGSAYAAAGGLQLKTALTASFNQSIAIGSASAVATNSTRLDTNTLIFQALFDSSKWTGRIQAFPINQTTGAIITVPTWDTDTAGMIPSYGSRTIYSYNAGGVDFVWGNLSASQQTSLMTAAEISASDNSVAQKRVTYIRGNNADEQQNSGVFRDRTKLLGDIVNSNPWYVGMDNFGYANLPGAEGTSYTSFLATLQAMNSGAGRTDVVYVGANDGMLHAFNAKTGLELFAYIPSSVIPNLQELTDPNYGTNPAHRYFVDGSPRAGDVYFSDSTWHTVLVGTTGTGGRNVFALDVTDPGNFTTGKVLWEFTDANDGDLGYTLSEPTIVRMANGEWAAIIGNGYNSTNHKAVLFIINAQTGAVIKKIDTGVGSLSTPNGLATPIPVDTDGDRVVDTIYAGDLLGNMWKFDVSGSGTSTWKPAYKSGSTWLPLFKAVDGSGVAQPITAKPQVGKHPNGGVMVYFGTGKYFESTDNIVGATPQIQSFYGIRDNVASGNSIPVVRSTDLVAQTIDYEVTSSGFDLRVTSKNTVTYPTKKGWHMDLKLVTGSAQGERVVAAPVIRSNRIVFTTLVPNTDPCTFGGSGWLMELDAVTGAQLPLTPFDINGDGQFTSADFVTVVIAGVNTQVPVSGKKSKVGIIKTPSVVKAGNKEYKYTSGSSGNLEATTESGGAGTGRQSWRQRR